MITLSFHCWITFQENKIKIPLCRNQQKKFKVTIRLDGFTIFLTPVFWVFFLWLNGIKILQSLVSMSCFLGMYYLIFKKKRVSYFSEGLILIIVLLFPPYSVRNSQKDTFTSKSIAFILNNTVKHRFSTCDWFLATELNPERSIVANFQHLFWVNLGGRAIFTPPSPSWFSRNNSKAVKAVILAFCIIKSLFITDIYTKFDVPNSHHSPVIGQNSRGFLVKSLKNKNYPNYRTSNDVNMKFRSVTKLD